MDPPVSVPSAKSQARPATADAEPDDDPPGTPVRCCRVGRDAVMRVAPGQAVGQFIHQGLAEQHGTGVEQGLNGIGRLRRLVVRLQPCGAAGARAMPGDVVIVLGSEHGAAKRPVFGTGYFHALVACIGIEVHC